MTNKYKYPLFCPRCEIEHTLYFHDQDSIRIFEHWTGNRRPIQILCKECLEEIEKQIDEYYPSKKEQS